MPRKTDHLFLGEIRAVWRPASYIGLECNAKERTSSRRQVGTYDEIPIDECALVCSDTILTTQLLPRIIKRFENMLTALYYVLMLLLGFAWYKFGQNLLQKGYRDENDQRTEGLVGPVGLLVISAVTCYLLFALLRALIQGEVPCIGKGCKVHVYTLAANAGDYWVNMFYIAWMVLGLSYAVYVTVKIWLRQ